MRCKQFVSIVLALGLICLISPRHALAQVEKAYLGQAAELQSWGILSCESETAYVLSSGTFETLLYWDGKNYKPRLAKSWKELSPLAIEFVLDDRKFSDGTQVESRHVAESLKAFNEKASFGKLMLQNIAALDIKDSRNFVIRLKQPDSLAIRRLAYWLRVFRCPEYCSPGLDEALKSPGTGPLKFTSYKTGQLDFNLWRRNPSASLIVYTGAMPTLEFIKKNRELGFIGDLSHHLDLTVSQQLGLKVVSEPMFSSSYGVFNLEKKDCHFCNKELREAFNLALNRKEINRLVFAESATLLTSLGLNRETGAAHDLKPIAFEPDRAKALIDKYKIRQKLKKLVVRVGAQSPLPHDLAVLKVIEGQLKKVGMELIVDSQYDVSIHSKFLDTIDLVWGTDPSIYNHTDFLLNNYFARSSPFFLNADKKIKDLHTKALQEGSESRSTAIFEEIDRYIRAQYYGVFGFQLHRNSAAKPDIAQKIRRSTFFNLSVIYE